MVATPFLKEIAGFLLEPGKYDLSRTCVVFPNKRARLYLARYLGELTENPVWAPRYQTINDLMESLSGWIYADRLTQLFELFRVYSRLAGTTETFDSFTQYAEPLLADFDEIDKYLVDAMDLFSNLEDLKAMEGRFSYLTEEQLAAIRRFWTTFEPEPTEGQKSFVSLWNLLGPLYSGFREALAEKGLAYEGMACRKVADQLADPASGIDFTYDKYLFVGFNALNKCEERLFRYLQLSGKAEFYWDYDNWYTNNGIHEAGFFIRQNIKAFPPKREVNHDNLLSAEKRIQFLSVPSRTGQARALPMVFEMLGPETEHQHTALVLADENLLIPVMYAIPGSVEELNITMGYPVAGSSVFTLVDTLIALDRNRRPSEGTELYYYHDVLSLLGNTLVKSRFATDYYRVRDLVTTHQTLYLSPSEIFGGTDRISLPGDTDACSYLLGVAEELVRLTMEKDGDRVQQEILYQLYLFLTRLNDLIGEQDFSPDRETLFRFVKRMLKTLHVPFSGEPLSGLQLLGILETRTLDFDNVIILSMNEGVLPRTSGMNSFIPHGLRFGFGLPVSGHQDSIYAYYFYRLIQRATNVILVYDSSTGGMQTGERSRFLHQLDYELPLPVVNLQPSFTIERLPVPEIRIEKTGEVVDALLRYTGERRSLLSPSAINEYLNCSLRFYFHHLAGLPQPEEVAEEIDARLFGILLHKAMQIVYAQFGNEPVTAVRLKELLGPGEGMEKAIEQAFAEVLDGGTAGPDPKAGGFGIIVKQVITTYMKNLIRADMTSAPITIGGLEKKVQVPVTFRTTEGERTVDIGGIIDRIDRVAGKTRIVDYKTGAVKDSFQNVLSLFDNGEKQRNDAVFQVLVYAMAYAELTGDASVIPGLCFVRGSHAEGFTYSIRHAEKKQMLQDYLEVKEEFEALLTGTLEQLFDKRIPFNQTTNSKTCKNCPYAVICGREG
jgi:CRISPR/Cas system-associated exonuclease Cas4 (RecB family)